jgi:predicted nucleic acid-binding protein
MTLVIDASVAVKWMVAEPGNDAARALLDLPDPLIAPDWILLEAASTFWKKVKSSELLEIHAHRHIAELPEFFSRLYDSHELAKAALELGFRLRHPVYDCLYLALAQREACRLVTADQAFFKAMERRGLADQAVLLEY